MDAAALLTHYGYGALVVGTFFEGEIILTLGGYAAHEGYLRLELVILFGALGAIASDQVCFYSGRFFGKFILNRFPKVKAGVDRVFSLLGRFRNWLVIGFQFFPGSSTVVPFALGLSPMRATTFMGLDLFSASLWATVFSYGGFVFGKALSAFVKDLRHYDAWLIPILILFIWVASYVRRRLLKPDSPTS